MFYFLQIFWNELQMLPTRSEEKNHVGFFSLTFLFFLKLNKILPVAIAFNTTITAIITCEAFVWSKMDFVQPTRRIFGHIKNCVWKSVVSVLIDVKSFVIAWRFSIKKLSSSFVAVQYVTLQWLLCVGFLFVASQKQWLSV